MRNEETQSSRAMLAMGLLALLPACGGTSADGPDFGGAPTDTSAEEPDEGATSGGEDEGDETGRPDAPGEPLDPDEPAPPVEHCRIPDGALDAPRACVDEAPPRAESFTPQVQWTFESTRCDNNVHGGLVVANLTEDNGDGVIDACDRPDVAFACRDGVEGVVFVLDGATGEVLLEHAVAAPEGLPYVLFPSVAAADLDDDGAAELVIGYGVSSEGREDTSWSHVVEVVRGDGTVVWSVEHEALHDAWLEDVAVADLDGDGQPEILTGRGVVHADGTLGWTLDDTAPAWQQMLAVDLDGDGDLEVVHGPHVYDHDGERLAVLEEVAAWGDLGHDAEWSSAVADLDEDGEPEIIIGAQAYTYGERGSYEMAQEQRVYVYSAQGRLIDQVTLEVLGEAYYAAWEDGDEHNAISVADIDGDGDVEALVATAQHGFVELDLTAWGSLVLGAQGDLPASIDPLKGHTGTTTSFDFLGRGRPHVLRSLSQGLAAYEPDGALAFAWIDEASAWWLDGAIAVADVDDDGAAEIVLRVAGLPNQRSQIVVLGDAEDAWVGARRIWNQSTYAVSHVREDGRLPAEMVPPWADHNTYRTQAPSRPPMCMPEG